MPPTGALEPTLVSHDGKNTFCPKIKPLLVNFKDPYHKNAFFGA